MLPKSMTLLIAVTVIFVGVILLLGNMGVIPNSVMAIWPVVLVVAGLVGLICVDPEKRKLIPHGRSSKKKK
ncbi:MAG: DUF5668 domain-containing protein [Patescibacteria group bacterium]